jgi:hypothetical protein
MCFDEKAALQLERDNKAKLRFDSIQYRLTELYDSTLIVRNKQITIQGDIIKGLTNNYFIAQDACKKGKRNNFLTGTAAGTIITLILVLLL